MQSQGWFNQLHGMVLGLVYRIGNRCKSSGAAAGAFPKPLPEPGWVGKASGPDFGRILIGKAAKSELEGRNESLPD